MGNVFGTGQNDGRATESHASASLGGVHRERSLNGSASGTWAGLRPNHASGIPIVCAAGGSDCTGAFDAAAWFADWSDNGGIVATIGDRLWIGRTPCLDRNAAERLDAIRGAIMHPEAATALRRVLRGSTVAEDA